MNSQSNHNPDNTSNQKLSWGKYSSNLGLFLKNIQDITLYIEDTAKEAQNFYKALIKNILPELKVKKIVPLGGRENVIQASLKPKKNNLKELYIIDGDLYCYYSKPNSIKNLFTHNAYCVENLLIDHHAVVTFIEDSLAISYEEAIELCDWENFISVILNNFNELFILYAICHKVKSPIKTVKRFNTAEWIDHSNKKCFKLPNINTISITVDAIKKHLIESIGLDNFNYLYQSIQFNLEKVEDDKIFDYISGKHYLIHFLKNFIASKGCPMSSISDDSLKYRLIKISEHKELTTLRDAILSVINTGEYFIASNKNKVMEEAI